MASEHLTLLQFIKILLGTGSESIQMRDYFQKDPEGALREHGLGHLSAEDVRDATVIAQDNHTVSFDRTYHTGLHLGRGWENAGHGGGHDGGHHHGGHNGGAEHVRWHTTNNDYTYNVDDRDTNIDNSVNQNIHTGGGDFKQSIDNHSVNSTGDGSVAAGGNITGSNIATGEGSVAGTNNHVVNGDGNTTAFGSGSATSTGHINADHGSAVSIGGNATGSNDYDHSFNETHNESHVSTHIDDSYNSDSSMHNHAVSDDHSTTETHIGSGNETNVDFHA